MIWFVNIKFALNECIPVKAHILPHFHSDIIKWLSKSKHLENNQLADGVYFRFSVSQTNSTILD